MTILTKMDRIDKVNHFFDGMDSPFAKAILFIFLLFVAVYFSLPVISIFCR